MAGRWFRFYDAALDDPKVGLLTDKQFRRWFESFREKAPKFQDRPPQKIWRMIRDRVFARDDYTCKYCGARGVRLECDHIVPVSRGGTHDDANLNTACFECNRAKRNKPLSEWKPAWPASAQ